MDAVSGLCIEEHKEAVTSCYVRQQAHWPRWPANMQLCRYFHKTKIVLYKNSGIQLIVFILSQRINTFKVKQALVHPRVVPVSLEKHFLMNNINNIKSNQPICWRYTSEQGCSCVLFTSWKGSIPLHSFILNVSYAGGCDAIHSHLYCMH
jgi:hypothetical protein